MIRNPTSIHIPEQQVCCGDCNEIGVITLQRFRDGRVRFRVECEECGTFSHYLDFPLWVERVIEEYLDKTYPEEKT